MIRHYLKIAFRNLRKYRNQTLVSVVGLAVGFVCFAMSALWIRYEMTFDSFHKNADRMYRAGRFIPANLAEYLKSTFPEVANATFVAFNNTVDFKYEGVNHKSDILGIEPSFLNMFDVKIVEGSMDFMIPRSGKLTITREKALEMFGNESPVGKKITMSYYDLTEYEICAVVTGYSKQSNYPFDFLERTVIETGSTSIGEILVEVVPGIDMEMFEKKLNETELPYWGVLGWSKNIKLVPITSIRYKDPTVKRDVKFQYIIIFALAGSLLILCTLFNYLTLFVSRFRMRQREFALRTVYGASGRSLFAMLSIEFLVSLIAALVLGFLLINILHSSFVNLSGAHLELSAIYLESIIYMAGIIVVALTVFFLTLMLFRRRTLDASIRSNKKILRKTSIVVQLTVSIVFAFCALIILKQMYYLHNTSDLGFSFKNRGSIIIQISSDQIAVLNDKMKQIPEITKTMSGYNSLLPEFFPHFGITISDWEDKPKDAPQSLSINGSKISEEYSKFYELELIEGEFLRDDDDKKYVLINESTAKAFGWYKSVGKSFAGYVVKGVIKNIYNFAPTVAPYPFMYGSPPNSNHNSDRQYVLFKYNEGNWKTCIEKIKQIVEKEFPNRYFVYYNAEEEYNKYLKSENALLAILTAVSLVCLMVCIFGFVSMVSLTCEERRKEIAIRKINGATVKDILDIFFKEYLTLLAIGALIAFPLGYIIMKRWLQQYVLQTEISAWVYLLILLALILVIILCVGGRVYKTSRENPVNALNK